MTNKISSQVASQFNRIRTNLTPRATLVTIVALGAVGALIYFLQKKPPLPPITETEPSQAEAKSSTPEKSSLGASIRSSMNALFQKITSFLPKKGVEKPNQDQIDPQTKKKLLQNL